MSQTPKPERRNPETDAERAGFKPSRLDIIVHEGTVINPNDKRINGAVVVRQGRISVETEVDAPDGPKTVVLDHVEAGEYFFEHLLFGYRDDTALKLQYRAIKRSTVVMITREWLSRNPAVTMEICGNMLRTRNREMDRLRQRAYHKQTSPETASHESGGLSTEVLKTMNAELADNLRAAQSENRDLASRLKRFESETRIFTSALDEAARDNQELWRYVRTLERKATEQERQIECLKDELSAFQCEDPAKAFNELTKEILLAQQATTSAKRMEKEVAERMLLMQRGFELLSKENPNVKLSMTVMLLLLGEEPPNLPPNPEFEISDRHAGVSPDELDQVFEDMPAAAPVSPAIPARERRPQGLSSKATVPPTAKTLATPQKAPRPAIPAPPPVPTAIACPVADTNARRESMPDITFAQEEANTDLCEIMLAAGEPVRQSTLLDPYEVAASAPPILQPFRQVAPSIGFAENEPTTRPKGATQAAPSVEDLNKTRTWGTVSIKPSDKNDEKPQVTRPLDVSAFRRDGKNKKDGR